jgi:putative membrane protein
MMATGIGIAELLIILAVIFFVLVGAVLLVILLVNRSGRSETPADSGGPLDILERRYARGEITREEFQTMRDDLNR